MFLLNHHCLYDRDGKHLFSWIQINKFSADKYYIIHEITYIISSPQSQRLLQDTPLTELPSLSNPPFFCTPRCDLFFYRYRQQYGSTTVCSSLI